jgi:gamma-glutamyl hercynylcysteine S-oxide synthase
MRHQAFDGEVTPDILVDWYRRARSRTRELFALIDESAYYDRPIPLRNPIVFYEGHLPAFAVNTLIKLTLQRPGIDERLERLFARGIDPEDEASAKSPTDVWPARGEVQAYAAEAERLVEIALENSEAGFTVIEHELMHQETLMYLIHALPYDKKHGGTQPAGEPSVRRTETAHGSTVHIPPGPVTLGQSRDYFGWDNEFPAMRVDVAAFELDAFNVTNAQYIDFVDSTGADVPHFLHREEGRWYRKAMFALEPVPMDAPVYVTHGEATAYARWKGMRLPTEAEWHRAAAGVVAGNFDFASSDPVSVGQFAPSAFGAYDLFGNGWEWTSSLFAPFPGFEPMPSYMLYSTDFFDGAHFVLKGASPATPRELVRPSFRNWFRPNYPWVFATFRCAR